MSTVAVANKTVDFDATTIVTSVVDMGAKPLKVGQQIVDSLKGLSSRVTAEAAVAEAPVVDAGFGDVTPFADVQPVTVAEVPAPVVEEAPVFSADFMSIPEEVHFTPGAEFMPQAPQNPAVAEPMSVLMTAAEPVVEPVVETPVEEAEPAIVTPAEETEPIVEMPEGDAFNLPDFVGDGVGLARLATPLDAPVFAAPAVEPAPGMPILPIMEITPLIEEAPEGGFVFESSPTLEEVEIPVDTIELPSHLGLVTMPHEDVDGGVDLTKLQDAFAVIQDTIGQLNATNVALQTQLDAQVKKTVILEKGFNDLKGALTQSVTPEPVQPVIDHQEMVEVAGMERQRVLVQ